MNHGFPSYLVQVLQMSGLRPLKESPLKVLAKGGFNRNLQKCDLTKFDGKVLSITYNMDETYRGKSS